MEQAVGNKGSAVKADDFVVKDGDDDAEVVVEVGMRRRRGGTL